MEFKQYRKTGIAEMRPYIPEEDLTDVSVSSKDTPCEGGMIARNSKDHKDQWYVNPQFVADNYELDISDSEQPCADPYNSLYFGAAINAVKAGKKISREEWKDDEGTNYVIWKEGYPGIRIIKASDPNNFEIWVPNQADMLADDWMIV